MHKLPALLFFATLVSHAQINVMSYGAVPDGRDSTAAIQKALNFAAAHYGMRIVFPCTQGNTYLITSPLTFPAYTTITGDGQSGCQILYAPQQDPGTVLAAFSLLNSRYVHIENIALTTAAHFPPQVILLMGGPRGASGGNTVEYTTISGYASQAVVYSISSECNHWHHNILTYQGGGARSVFYTSNVDVLGICSTSCQSGTNLSLYFMDNKISVAGNDSLNAITSKLNGQGTGDQYYRRNTIMLNDAPGSTGIALISGSTAGGGPNTNVVFADSRIEKGTYGIHFIKDSQATLYNVVVNNVTWQPDKSGFASAFGFGDDQLTLKNLTMAHNNVVPGSAISSSFYQLSGSRITESYGPIIVRATSAGNIYTLFANASVTMPAASASNVVLRPAGPAHHN